MAFVKTKIKANDIKNDRLKSNKNKKQKKGKREKIISKNIYLPVMQRSVFMPSTVTDDDIIFVYLD